MVVMYLLLREGSMYGLGSADWPSMDDWARLVISQQRTREETTWNSLPSSAYWYLMGGPGPSSSDTEMKREGTFSFSN